MKRLVIALILLALILGSSCLSLFFLERDLAEIGSFAARLREENPSVELEKESEELFRLWNEKEKLLVIFVRHDVLDEVTVLMAELPSLARHGEYGHFYSGLDVILARLDDLLDSARPTYRNLL